MRLVVLLGLLTFAHHAHAQPVDCLALRAGGAPYEVTFASVPLATEPQIVLVEQYFPGPNDAMRRRHRAAGQSAVFESQLRFAFGQRTERVSGGPPLVFEVTYEGVDLARDPFAARRDFSYTRRIRVSGQPERVDHSAARFLGEETMTVSGCGLPVVVYEIERRAAEPRPGEPATTTQRLWYAPDLRGFLRVSVSAPHPQDYAAVRISTSFTPLQ
jgi:hypothetical protein